MNILADDMMTSRFMDKFSSLNDKNFYLVQLEQNVADRHLQDVCGLDQVLEVAPIGLPVIMLGWMPDHMYVDKVADKWFAANGYSNVTFLLMLATPEEVRAEIEKIEAGNRQSDPLAIALLGVAQMSTTLSRLHHDITSAQRDENRKAEWMKAAQALYGDKSWEELVAIVTEASRSRNEPGKLAGQSFPDVCVDIEGTILTAAGEIRSDVLALAKEKAQGGPITIWTGGDVHTLSAQLRKADILYKIVSKETMRGATVRVVIDDLPEATFKDQYGVDFHEFIQV